MKLFQFPTLCFILDFLMRTCLLWRGHTASDTKSSILGGIGLVKLAARRAVIQTHLSFVKNRSSVRTSNVPSAESGRKGTMYIELTVNNHTTVIEKVNNDHIRVTGYNGSFYRLSDKIPEAVVRKLKTGYEIQFNPCYIDAVEACKAFARYVLY